MLERITSKDAYSSEQIESCSEIVLHEFPSLDLERVWRDSLSLFDFPSHYGSPEFFAEPSWKGRRPFAILALAGRSVVAVLPAITEGRKISSRRYVSVARNVDHTAVGDILVRRLLQESRAANLVTVDSFVPLDSFLQNGFRSQPVGGVIVLDLSGGPDALFKQFHIKRRSNIRAALRRGVQVLTPTSETQIAEFYEVYEAWRGTKRKHVHGDRLPLEVFKERFRLKNNFQFILANFSGRIIAGIILRFAPTGLVECASNSSLDEFLHLRPNDLLVWNAIQWACNQGFSRMSLGAGHRFLREFGGISIPVYRYRKDQTRFRRYDMAAGITNIGQTNLAATAFAPAKRNTKAARQTVHALLLTLGQKIVNYDSPLPKVV